VYQGKMNAIVALLAATLGSVLGAVVLYEAGRYGGRPLLLRWGHVLRVDEAKLDRADTWMDRHGTKIVFAARMVPLARSVVSVPAGTTQMGRARFLLYTTVGSLLWNTALIGAGYLLGSAYEKAAGPVSTAGKIVAVLAVVGGVYLFWRTQRIRRRSPQAVTDDGDDRVDVPGQGG
jgi:membrane protein DedA with SNARE-associated domain